MNAKHTPGPWFSDSDGRIWRRDPKDLYENGGHIAGDRPIAAANIGWFGADLVGYPVADNASLIAAAPELLEALEELMVAVEKAKNAKTAGEEQVALVELLAPARKARAAIAKAKGEA